MAFRIKWICNTLLAQYYSLITWTTSCATQRMKFPSEETQLRVCHLMSRVYWLLGIVSGWVPHWTQSVVTCLMGCKRGTKRENSPIPLIKELWYHGKSSSFLLAKNPLLSSTSPDSYRRKMTSRLVETKSWNFRGNSGSKRQKQLY